MSRLNKFNNFITPKVYDFIAWPVTQMLASKVVRELNGVSGELLEIGCGTGMVTAQLAKLPVNIVATDLSEHMLQQAERRIQRLNFEYSVFLKSSPAEALAVESGKFDAVVMAQTLRHIKPENCSLVMQEIERVTKPKAKVVIADLNLPLTGAFRNGVEHKNPNYTILGILAVYNPVTLGEYMRDYGFTVRSVRYYPLFFVLTLDKQN